MDNTTIYYDQEHCKVVYDKEEDIIIGYWKGYQTLEKCKIAFDIYLDAIVDTKCPVIIGDLSKVQGSFTVINDWVEKEWLPSAIKKGHRINAMVYSPDIFSKFAINDLNARYLKAKTSIIQIKLFHSFVEAKSWVEEQRVHI